MRVTDDMVEAGLSAARDASEARLPRYSVVRAILEAALSHAAGQDGEQCRAASGDADLGTWLWGKLMDFCQKRRMPLAEYNDLFEIVDELRALSRGVPEGK